MAETNELFPGSVATASESPWSDNNWSNATYIQADDSNYASVTASTFDSPDQTYVMKAYNFDLSSIPDGSQILGVTVKIRAWYANGAGSIDLVQLLNTSRAKVGTNKASTPQALTTSQADYTFGGAADLWGNALTPSWVKDADFGVAIGCLAGGTDTDVYIDWVKLQVTYRPPITIGTESYGLTGTAVAMIIAVPMLSTVYGLTGSDVTMSKGRGPLTPEAGSYSLSGSDVTLKKASKLQIGDSSFEITGTEATLKVTRKIAIAEETYALTGDDITFGAGARVLPIGSASYELSGSNVGFQLDVPIDSGVYGVSGTAVTLRWGQKIVASGESYALTGADVATKYGRKIAAATDSYAVDGQNVTLKRAGYLLIESGSIQVDGTELTLTYTPSGAKLISIGGGSYELTGTAVGMIISVPMDYGYYVVTGSAATLQKGGLTGKGVIADAGSYAINGTAAGLVYEVWFDPGNYFITGTAANLLYIKYRLTAATRAFVITGATTLQLEIGMPAEAGSYSLAGSNVNLTHGVASGYSIGIGSRDFMIVNWIYDDVVFRVDRRLVAGSSSYAISAPHDTALKLNRAALQPPSGEYLVTGGDIVIGRTYKLAADGDSYSVDGTDAALTAGEPPLLSAEGGSYELTGEDAGMHVTNYIVIGSEVYVVEGVEASLLKVDKLTADESNYAVTGYDVGMFARSGFLAEAGDYDLTGDQVDLVRPAVDYSIAVVEGSYSLSGTAATPAYGYNLVVEDDAYVLTGGDELTWDRTYVLTAGSGRYDLYGYGGHSRRTSTFWRKN